MPFIEQTSRRKLLLGGVALGAAAVAGALGGRFLARSQAPRVILGDGASGPLRSPAIP